jgi:hypothetical protein
VAGLNLASSVSISLLLLPRAGLMLIIPDARLKK